MAMTLSQQLGCFGYYGFGGGYALGRWGPSSDGAPMYCNRCERAAACWTRHRVRVRALFPDACALVDEITANRETAGGLAFMEEWLRRTGQTRESFVEPFSSVMMGNMTDGACVATTGDVSPERQGDTIRWPLQPLEDLPR